VCFFKGAEGKINYDRRRSTGSSTHGTLGDYDLNIRLDSEAYRLYSLTGGGFSSPCPIRGED